LSLPFMLMTEGTVVYSLYNIIQSLVWAILVPALTVFSYLMYKDLRHIKG